MLSLFWDVIRAARFVQELSRLTVHKPLALDRRAIAILSGLIFGIPHHFGTPGGILGAAMAKSVMETRGIFWAWFIHFLQDVVIFAALFSVVLG